MFSDTLLDLHSKLATVVRYYDRMLEDRLSNTYSQHNLSNGRPHVRQSSSNMYPTIPTEPPAGQGGAESYYHMNGAPQTDIYVPPQSQFNFPPSQLSYTQRDRAPSNTSASFANDPRPQHNAQTHQQASSLQTYPHSPAQRQEPFYYSQNQHQDPQNLPSSPMEDPPHTLAPDISQDSGATYYNVNHPQISPPQLHQQQRVDHNYGPAASPDRGHPVMLQQQQTYSNHVPHQNALPPQPQPLYKQPQQAVMPPQQPQSYAAPYPSTNAYNQESFPTAPNHQPEPKQVEESLIEL